jgi:hypothetical protein
MHWIIDGKTTLLCLETAAYITLDGETWHHRVPSDEDCGGAINGPAALAALGYRWDGAAIVSAASIMEPAVVCTGGIITVDCGNGPVAVSPAPQLVPVDLSVPAEGGRYVVTYKSGGGEASFPMAPGEEWQSHDNRNIAGAWRIVWPEVTR